MTSIQVSVRVRPFNGREKKYNSKLIVDMKGPVTEIKQVKQGKIMDQDPRKFTFDHCFWTHDPSNQDTFDGQEKVYNTIGKTILDNCLNGFNGCLFAYGQTGSGKTYTMMGIDSDPGIIPRLAKDLFGRADSLKDTHAIAVECSYLEIYNEHIRDLLNPAQGDKPLKARQHPKLGVYVENLTKLSAGSGPEIEKFIEEGAEVRSVAATNMNAQSSRSHAILTLNIRVKTKDGEVASQLHLVDLAGSERAGSTGAEGQTLTEGANINKSLTTLGMCLSRLAEEANKPAGAKKGHIPFRDSQLTWLLNDSLGGNSRTAMLANISPADINFEETLSTLRFAATTKKIKNNAVVNEDPQQRLIKELRAEIAQIKEQIEAFDAGNPSAGLGTPGDDGAADPADLATQLTMNMNLMLQAGATEEEKQEADRQAKIEREKAMKKLQEKKKQESRTVDNSQPRIITLNEDLHALPTVALLYYIPDGESWVGTSKEGFINLPGTCVSKEKLNEKHFSIKCDMENRKVFLSVPKESKQRSVSTTPPPESPTSPTPSSPSAASNKRDALVFVNGQPLNYATAEKDTTTGTPTTPTPASTKHADPMAGVEGAEEKDDEEKKEDQQEKEEESVVTVELNHMDRIVVGSVAFRFSRPQTWIIRSQEEKEQEQREEFSRLAETLTHLQHLQDHDRLAIERQAATQLHDIVDHGEVFVHLCCNDEIRELIEEWVASTNYSVGESETKMVEFYPLSDDAVEAQQDRHQGLQYDYHYAMQEKSAFFKDLEKKAKEAQLNQIQVEAEEKEAEINALKEQLEREQKEQEEALAKKKEELEASANKRKSLQPSASSSAHAQSQRSILSELQHYEEECRQAKEWKPSGPSDAEDAKEYLMANQGPTLDSVRNKLDVKAEFMCQKYRIKKGFFGSKPEYINVLLLVRSRFIYWYEEEKKGVQTFKPEGTCYIWGCDIQQVMSNESVAMSKKHVIRIVPCVPRGGTGGAKGAKAGGDENAVVLSFQEGDQLESVSNLIKDLSEPPCPERVKEYRKAKGLV